MRQWPRALISDSSSSSKTRTVVAILYLVSASPVLPSETAVTLNSLDSEACAPTSYLLRVPTLTSTTTTSYHSPCASSRDFLACHVSNRSWFYLYNSSICCSSQHYFLTAPVTPLILHPCLESLIIPPLLGFSTQTPAWLLPRSTPFPRAKSSSSTVFLENGLGEIH